MFRMKGSWVAIITPYNADGGVDIGGFRVLVDFQHRAGTDGILLMGSTGESSLLSVEEKKRIIREICPYAKGKIPVFVGTTCNTTRETVELSLYAKDHGADGLLLVVPPYCRPPQDSIYEFFATVAEATELPIAIYNNPSRVGVNIDASTIVRLADIPNIVADKEAIPNVSQLVNVRRKAGDKIAILCCDYPGYGLILPTLAMGGDGVTNIVGNVIPRQMAEMSQPWSSWEDVERTRRIYFRYLPLMEAAYSVSNPVPLKAAMEMLGLPAGPPRKPLPELRSEAKEKLQRLLEELEVTID